MMPNQLPGAMPQGMIQVQPPQWQPRQPMPAPAHLASGVQNKPPIIARGVAPTPVPPPPAIEKFVLPRPDVLGVSTSLSLPEQKPAAPSVDWNQLQVRMERLGVLRYQKARMEAGVIHVTMLFPTNDPTKGLPMSAQAGSEADAVVMILNYAEELARKR